MQTDVLNPVIDDVLHQQGSIYAVGGAVRDEILELDSKDLDVLITGIPYQDLLKLLRLHGKVDEVGKSFGIIKFTPVGSREVIDVALPRTERSTGEGHKDFEVNFDHTLSVESDLARRDFTINAIAKNLVSGEYIDPFNGLQHLKNRMIHPVYGDSFKDDPLRILRGLQFAARFDFHLSGDALDSVYENKGAIRLLSPERIAMELAKLFGKGKARKLNFALDSVWDQVFPELCQNFYDWENEPMTNAPEDMELRLLILVGSTIYDDDCDDSLDVPTVQQLEAICERLKLSSGGFNVPRMLKLYSCAMDTNPISLQSDADVRRFVSRKLDGDRSAFMDLCKLWACLNDGSAIKLVTLCEQLFRTNQEPLTLKDLKVNGKDIMDAGMIGKDVGETLNRLLEDVLEDPSLNSRENLLKRI